MSLSVMESWASWPVSPQATKNQVLVFDGLGSGLRASSHQQTVEALSLRDVFAKLRA